MEITLNDGKRPVMIRYNEGVWELCYMKTIGNKDTGEQYEIFCAEKWFSSLAGAMNKLAEIKIGNSNAKSIKELLKVIADVKSEITNTYKVEIK